jgi:small nuclear ribonucleoprotein (snRNP)-like protein
VNHEVTVELKNDISVRGTLKSVDQYLNIKLDDISVVEELKYPHLVSCARLRSLRDEERDGKLARGEVMLHEENRRDAALVHGTYC